MPESKRKAMLKVFSKLKQRIIWKWETSMDDAPRDGFIKNFQMIKKSDSNTKRFSQLRSEGIMVFGFGHQLSCPKSRELLHIEWRFLMNHSPVVMC